MKKSYVTHADLGKTVLYRRLCALVLAMTIFVSVASPVLGEGYDAESYLSLYYSDATMEEGKTSGYTERFFANIAAIAMMDLSDQDFYTQLAKAVDNKYNLRVFLLHEKGMPDTDFEILYCFEDSSWLMKNTTDRSKSVYLDVSWEVLQGVNLKLKQEKLLKNLPLDYDDSYECNAKYVWQIFMEFVLFIEERNKAFQQMLAGTTDDIPELPEEIDSWPLVIPVSVQLPKELTVLDAFFTVEPTGSAAATIEQIPESQRYEGTVSNENVATGSLSFWESGPHLIRLVFTVSLDGHNQSMSHNFNIDTSSVRIADHDACPIYESGHQWKFEWAEKHPHYGHLICDCGEEQIAADMPTVKMLNCCECLGVHEWAEPIRIGKIFQHTCLRCGLQEEITPAANVRSFYNVVDQMTDMQKRSANYPKSNGVSAWKTVAGQAIDKLLDKGFVITSEALDKYSDMFGSIKDAVFSNETWDDIQIALWEDILIQMLNDEEQESSPEKEDEDFIKFLNNNWDLFKDLNEQKLDEQIKNLEESAEELGKQVQSINERADSLVPAGHNALVEHLEEQANNLGKDLDSVNDKANAAKGSKNTVGKLGAALKVISAMGEGLGDAVQLAQRNNEFEKMMRDSAKHLNTLNQIISVCEQTGNTTLQTAAENVKNRLEQEIEATVNQFLSEADAFMRTTAAKLAEEIAKWGTEKLIEKGVEKIVEGAGSDVLVPLKVIELVAGGAKILLDWNDSYEDALELMSLSTMDASLNVLGTLQLEDSEAMAKVWGALQTRGCEKAEEFLTSWENAKGLSTEEFGLGKDRLDWALEFLENDKESYLTFTRQSP